MEELEQELENDLRDLIAQMKEEVYYPSLFVKVLNEKGARETVINLVSGLSTDGFAKLLLAGRLDLTIEAFLIGNPQYKELFGDKIYAQSEARLKESGYENI